MLFRRFTALVLSAPRLYATFLAVVVAITLAGLPSLGVDFTAKSFFGSQDPDTQYLSTYIERWGEDDILFIVGDGQGVSFLERSKLEDLESLIQEVEAVEGIKNVLGLPRVHRVRRGFAGTWIPVPLLATAPREDAPEAAVETWRAGLLDDARLVPNLLSVDGTRTALLVQLSVETDDFRAIHPVVARVREVLAGRDDGVHYSLAGVPAIRTDVLDVVVADQVGFGPIAGVLMALLLWALFRSAHGVLIPGLAAVLPLFMLLGVMGWSGEPFGLLNQILLMLIPAIALADAIHLLTRYHQELAVRVVAGQELGDAERHEAILATMEHLGVACLLTSTTTIVGFLSLRIADMPVLRQFGAYAAIGSALAFFTVIFVVPLAVHLTKPGLPASGSEGDLAGRIAAGLARAIYRSPVSWVAAAVVISVLSLYGASQVKVDARLTATFVEEHPTTIANHLVDDHLGGVMALEYEFTVPEGRLEEPAVLQALAAFEADALEVPAVRATWGLASVLAASSVLVGGPDGVPDDPRAIRRLLSLVEQSGRLHLLESEDRTRGRLIVRTRDVGAAAFAELGQLLTAKLEERLAPHDVDIRLTGTSHVAYQGVRNVASSLQDSLLFAMLVIGIMIGALFRSLRMGVLSVLPNVIPLLVAYGAMALFGWTFEPAAGLIFTVAIGISVDNAIHVLTTHREAVRLGMRGEAAILHALQRSGMAIVVTSVLLAIGLGVNTLSASPINALLGKLGAIAILSAMVAALGLLPALLVLGEERRDEASA